MLSRLSPDALHLRKLAREWRAGDLTMSEYRAERRAIISQLAEAGGVSDSDEPTPLEATLQRFGLETTLRRTAPLQMQKIGWRPQTTILLALLLVAIATSLPRFI